MLPIHFRLLLLALLIGAVLLLSACKDSTSTSATPGDIIGTIYRVYDTLYQPMANRGGVTIALLGTPYSTQSDSTGRWQLTNIPAGTYTIRFTRTGYVSKTKQNFVFGGNGTFLYDAWSSVQMEPLANLFPNIVLRPFTDLIQISFKKDTSIVARIDSILIDSTHPVALYDTIRKFIELDDTVVTKLGVVVFSSRSQFMYHGQYVYGDLFLGKDQNIDPADPTTYQYSLINYSTYNNGVQNKNDSSGFANFTVQRTDLLSAGFSENQTIYCVAYVNVSNYYDSWLDVKTERTAYSGFSPHHSDVVTFVLP
jgi:hypothetical protein